MKVEGTIVEMGNLESHETPTPGIALEVGDQIIEVAGLTIEQIKALPMLLYRKVVLTIEATP